MDEETKDKYREAGRIAAKAREAAKELCEPGVALEEIAETAEKIVRDEGAKPAFPVNTSVNEAAAHYTPSKEDDQELSEGDVLKIDVGAHVDGYIGDTAVTVDLGDHADLVEAARAALSDALHHIEPGTNLGEIGKVIQDSIESRGFKPVRNLGGHGLDRYTQHSGDRIPNVGTDKASRLEPGNAYAIEPFATSGEGKVQDASPGNIYKFEGGNARDRTARKILKQVKQDYRTLPFTSRWFDVSPARLQIAIRNLVKSGVFHEYEVLKEVGGGLVSQAEHTILVFKDGIEVTTRRD
ncbi:MAG: type II methionyl aminopeptidase [Candidatus Nanohaloarchaea archaeon]|nr:type II methionyl aminopeptidase [Candidatus Nanohaloarchaea archaeon]